MMMRKTNVFPFGFAMAAALLLAPVSEAQTAGTPPAGPFQPGQNKPDQAWARSLPMPYWMQQNVPQQPSVQTQPNVPQAGTAQQQRLRGPNRPYVQNRTWTPFGTFTQVQPNAPQGYYTPYAVGAPNQYYGYVPPSFPIPPFFPSGPWGGYRGPVAPGYGYQNGYGMPPRPQN